jgi:hypothetical protein
MGNAQLMRKPIGTRIGPVLSLLALMSLVTACEKTMEPATGERTTRVTIPGTAAHGERIEERWRRCLLFNPESLCARRVPGGRPDGGPGAISPLEAEARQDSGSEPED